jgi:hypothetical protein
MCGQHCVAVVLPARTYALRFHANGKPVKDKNGKVKMISPYKWLVQNRRAAAMTWVPGELQFIHNRLPVATGWVMRAGATTFNTYQAKNARKPCRAV